MELTLTATDQILLVPSHFVWPEFISLALKDLRHGQEQQTILITYALDSTRQEGAGSGTPEDLSKLLRSLADPTRLQILQLLARRSRSTREIAGLIGLTEAAISKHLKHLQEAGWVAPERHSYYVYYRLVRESLKELPHGLDEMLG